uniref:Uncharacterized protein n=1 Tax=Meloidogyne hapla TaxID=6305 RepID=A0A1I8C1D0_MELHA
MSFSSTPSLSQLLLTNNCKTTTTINNNNLFLTQQNNLKDEQIFSSKFQNFNNNFNFYKQKNKKTKINHLITKKTIQKKKTITSVERRNARERNRALLEMTNPDYIYAPEYFKDPTPPPPPTTPSTTKITTEKPLFV